MATLVIGPGVNVSASGGWRVDYFSIESLRPYCDLDSIPDFAKVEDENGNVWIEIDAMVSEGLWGAGRATGTVIEKED